MSTFHFTSPTARDHPLTINRIAERHWHALADDRVVGRGETFHRPDGRTFLSIDTWHRADFRPLAAAMLRDLPRPLFTIVDEADRTLTDHWQRAGFAVRRRELEYRVPTDPLLTGLIAAPTPPGLTILPVGVAELEPLRALDRLLRNEIRRTDGRSELPAEILPRPDGPTSADVGKYAAAALGSGEYVALLRLVSVRQPRIGLLAVRADLRRRGIGRAMLARVLDDLHRAGIPVASADVHQSNVAAIGLFDGIGGRVESSNLELVLR
jgi:ribosomal protein S18 acetylase RimI-like enzyme